MDMHVRTTGVIKINTLREYLWKNIYSDPENLSSLIHNLNQSFADITGVEFRFNFSDSTVNIVSTNREFTDSDDIFNKINKAYEGFLTDISNRKCLDDTYKEACMSNINQLCMITFLNNNSVRIGL